MRLPKVYGPEDNGNLATVYGFRNYSAWRWTHGYVENVAHAVVQAIVNERAIGRIYNVGEEITPTVAERLAYLPPNPNAPILAHAENFSQYIAYDTTRIRTELGYTEEIPEREAMSRSAAASIAARKRVKVVTAEAHLLIPAVRPCWKSIEATLKHWSPHHFDEFGACTM
jgi:nucleoside-diphosphate-sugar epimerase